MNIPGWDRLRERVERTGCPRSDRRTAGTAKDRGPIETDLADDAVVAFLGRKGDVFTFRRRHFDVPAGWVCLTMGADGPGELLGAGATLTRGSASEFLFARTGPVRIHLNVTGGRSADQYDADITVSTRVQVLPERGELISLRRELLSDSHVVHIRDIERFLAAGLRDVVVPLLGRTEMEALFAENGKEEMVRTARRAVDTAAFVAGLSVDDEFDLHLDCPAYERLRRTQQIAMHRRREQDALASLSEAERHARTAQWEHAEALLNRLQSLTARSPGTSIGELIRTFAEQERARLYEALFARAKVDQRTRAIVVACGETLLLFDPEDVSRPPRQVTLTGRAGPVRSLTYHAGARRLLAGAATGVYVVSPDDWRIEREVVAESSPGVRGGFNAAALHGDTLLASHSELGIRAWSADTAHSGVRLFPSATRDAKAVRAVQVHGGRAFCAVDQRILSWPADRIDGDPNVLPDVDVVAAASPITALKVIDDGWIIGDGDGRVVRLQDALCDERQVLHVGRGRAVESLALLDHDGIRRLFFSDTSVCIHARVLGDTFTWRYEASGQTLRKAAVAPDLIAVVTDLRDRVLLFRGHEPSRPSAVLLVSQCTGRSVQDVVLI